jgi:hypothetical protein
MNPISSAVQQEQIKEVMNMEIVLSIGALIHEMNYLEKDTKHYRLSSIRISLPLFLIQNPLTENYQVYPPSR